MKFVAVLVGGSGSRMGFTEKPLIKVCGRRIIDRIADLHFPLLIVCGESNFDIYREVADELSELTDVRVVKDAIPQLGPLGGIYTALLECDSVVAVGGDMPFVKREVVSFLFKKGEELGCDALIPEWSDGKKEPLLAYYSSSALPAFRETIERGERRIMQAVSRMKRVFFISVHEIKNIDKNLISFFNVNTPEDLKRAEELCSSIDLEGE